MATGTDTGRRLTLSGHVNDLGGGLVVRRLLPAAKRQSVGPFLFFDHFGPLVQQPDDNSDVRPHPHIGLATVTYLFEGAMMHRDSLGTVQRIEAGAVNWMTAGRGIAHSERTPEDLRGQVRPLHGLQLWVALPQDQEECAPHFQHIAASDVPQVSVDGALVRVIAGQAWDAASPVRAASPTLYLDISLPAGQHLDLSAWAQEMAIYTVDQALRLDDDAEPLPAHTMAVLDGATRIRNEAQVAARFVVIGGAPMDGPRFIWWNFVSSQKGRINQAAQDWDAGLFKRVPGDDERIALPAKRPW